MSTITTQNSNQYAQMLSPDQAVLVMIDHQAGLFLGVQSMNQQVLKNNAIALAKEEHHD